LVQVQQSYSGLRLAQATAETEAPILYGTTDLVKAIAGYRRRVAGQTYNPANSCWTPPEGQSAMLRDKSLIPLSHQHQHALALCVRIERASPIRAADLSAWQKELTEHFRAEIAIHFVAEEQVLFPAARRFKDVLPLVEDLLADHAWLRESFAQAEAGKLSAQDVRSLAERLSAHIRKEERQLFQRLQELMSPKELADVGKQLADALSEAMQACVLPTEATKLRSNK